MPDHPKSSSPPSPPPPLPDSTPPSWEDAPTFRETFLLHLPPDLHRAVREAGRGIFTTALELELPSLPKPWTQMRLRAVAADRFEASLSEEESRLAERAETWALKLHQIARRMEEATS